MLPRDRRALASGAGGIALAILAFRVMPWAAHSAVGERDRLLTSRALLEQAQSDLRDAARFQDSAITVRRRLDSLAPMILSGESDAEAWSDLEGLLRLVAGRNGAALQSSSRLPDSVQAGLLRRVSGRAQLESDLRGVLAALVAIERNPVALRVSEVRLEATSPDSPPGAPEVLRAEFVVDGWFLSHAKRRAVR